MSASRRCGRSASLDRGGCGPARAAARDSRAPTGCSPTAPRVAPYLTDHRRLYHGRGTGRGAPALGRRSLPGARAVQRARASAVVPHGGNTGYCGGATPDDSGRQLVLSLERLNRIRSVDAANDSLVAEAGCMLAQVQAAAADARALLSAEPGLRGQLPDRRQPLHQRRRHERAALRHDARPGARTRGGAGRRARARGAQRRCARTTPATTSSRCSSAPRARSGSSPPRA